MKNCPKFSLLGPSLTFLSQIADQLEHDRDAGVSNEGMIDFIGGHVQGVDHCRITLSLFEALQIPTSSQRAVLYSLAGMVSKAEGDISTQT